MDIQRIFTVANLEQAVQGSENCSSKNVEMLGLERLALASPSVSFGEYSRFQGCYGLMSLIFGLADFYFLVTFLKNKCTFRHCT